MWHNKRQERGKKRKVKFEGKLGERERQKSANRE